MRGPEGVLRPLTEAFSGLATVDIVQEILARALERSHHDQVPSGGAMLASFVGDALRVTVVEVLGPEPATLVHTRLQSALGLGFPDQSGIQRKVVAPLADVVVQPPSRVNVLVATSNRRVVPRLRKHLGDKARVRGLDDIFALLTGGAADADVLVIDCRTPGFRPSTIDALTNALTPGTRTVLWGADEALTEATQRATGRVAWIPVPADAPEEDVAWLCDLPRSNPADLAAVVGTVLLVDDDRSYLSSTARLLSAFGWQVIEANDGPSAIALCRAARPAAVFSDHHMPGMTGLEMAAALRAELGSETPPIVLVTAGCLEELDLTPVDRALQKPVPPHELVRLLNELGDGTRQAAG